MNIKGKTCPLPPNGPGFRSKTKEHLEIRNQISEFVNEMTYPKDIHANSKILQNLKIKLNEI